VRILHSSLHTAKKPTNNAIPVVHAPSARVHAQNAAKQILLRRLSVVLTQQTNAARGKYADLRDFLFCKYVKDKQLQKFTVCI
jgi:hypothetical protein